MHSPIIALILSLSQTLMAQIPENQLMVVGESRWLPSTQVQVIGNEVKDFLEVSTLGNRVLVKAKKQGTALLRVDGNLVSFEVLSWRQLIASKDLQKIIHRTLGLNVQVEGGQVSIVGKLLRWQDWELLASQCQSTKCEYQMLANVSETLAGFYEKKLNEFLIQESLPPQKFSFSPQGIKVLASPNMVDLDRLRTTLGTYGIQVLVSKQAVELLTMVELAITVAEVRKSELLNYGVQWASTYQTQVIPNINLLEQRGTGRILATPKILCRSGESAEFLAGGEFPIKILRHRTQEVIWKKYGIQLKTKPIAEANGKLSLSIETEIISIDKSKTVDGIPGLFTNRIQSHINLLNSQSIVLSGLLKAEDGESSQGFPALSQIPILGTLFSSKEFQSSKTELLIIVTPKVVHPGATL